MEIFPLGGLIAEYDDATSNTARFLDAESS
jgi:hypothetical protein